MVMAVGLAGVASGVCCYPLDVVKTRLQAQSPVTAHKYNGIFDCLQKTVKQEGHNVLWRGLGIAIARAFVVNGAIFSAYEIALRCFFNNGNIQDRSHNVE
ncbi:Mitochondrial arginine transporter BAC2 [Hibiscus syriacus]|uniref:Mitochondrial arginine transporter BAC2 n=1 Tax=Hibiscus syriacus TaxID=106335 RepID=A0A6A3AN36_HIBSY|nr:Mitochondrial arginine transporter BAC2 [Hibiscus syriacus]